METIKSIKNFFGKVGYKLNGKISRYIIFGITAVLYFVLILLLFAINQDTNKGFMSGWVIAIIVGLSGMVLTGLNIYEVMKYNKWSVTTGLSLIAAMQLVMIIFSIVDIAGAPNYIVSTICFVSFPIAAFIGNAINIK